MSLSHGSLAMQFSLKRNTRATGARKRRSSSRGHWASGQEVGKGHLCSRLSEVSNQATFVWPDDSRSFDLHDLFEKHQQRQIEEGRLFHLASTSLCTRFVLLVLERPSGRQVRCLWIGSLKQVVDLSFLLRGSDHLKFRETTLV